MRRAVLAVVLLLSSAAAAFSGTPAGDLQRRARLLLREIRAQSAAPKKDTARLRAELSALKAENSASPDDKISDHLRRAEANLAFVDAELPLPPPTIDETITDADLPDRDSVAQPAVSPRAPVLQNAQPATLPEAAGPIFDGSGRHAGRASPSVGVPPEAPTENLDEVLDLENWREQLDFLVSASAGLLEKLKKPDDLGVGANCLGERLYLAITQHPQLKNFISVHVTVPKDGQLHLIYRVNNGGAVDEILGPLSEWMTPRKHGKGGGGGGGKGKKRSGKKGGGGGGGDDGDGGGGGSSHGGKKGHGGGGHGGGKKSHGGGAGGGAGGGGDDDGDGGGDGGGGGGGGAGKGGRGPSHHAKAPHAGGGGSMFDGGDESGDASGDASAPGAGAGALGGGGRHGRGGGHHKGHGADAEGGGGGSGQGDEGAGGGGHAAAGKSISGGDESAGPSSHSGKHKKRNASVPLPKDFTTHGAGSRLEAGGGGGSGSKGEGGGFFQRGGMGGFGRKGEREAPPSSAVSRTAPAPALSAPARPAASAPAAATMPAASVAAASPGVSPVTPPFTAETDLHDAVAAHSAVLPRAVPQSAPTPAAPAAPEPLNPWPLAVAGAALLALGAYAFHRSRQA